ncbi:MAG TPA: glycosyltransferase family 87 protein, partial [Isosphaeraceae bacterium]|nr:glycosyltransferase family 87 protein [Isosphaeraceae bacterium]
MNLLLLAFMFATERAGRTALGPGLGADYPAFHIAGFILNRYPPDRLYDAQLQDRLYHQLLPARPREEMLPFAQGPIIAFLLRPFAALPYAWSYAGWLLLSGGMALAALILTFRTAGSIPRSDRITAMLLALSFAPLLTECWLGGQTSAFGLFWVALALRCERLNRPFAVGAALAMCLYKPTLLLLLIPMLAVGGRFRTLVGFAAAGLGLAAFCLVAIRPAGCLAYVQMILGYAQNVAGSTTAFRTFKFIDIRSFFTLLLGGPGKAVRWASLATALIGLPFLVACWWKAGRQGGDRRLLAFCATIS